MAKSVSCACTKIAIILTIFGSIQCAKSISPDNYYGLETQLPSIRINEIVSLSTEQTQRHRRAVPVDSTPVVASTQDVKNQYQSLNTNSSNGSGDATVTTVDSKAMSSTGSVAYNVHNVGVNGTGQRKEITAIAAEAGAVGAAAPVAATAGTPTAAATGGAASNMTNANMANTQAKSTQTQGQQMAQKYPKKVAAQTTTSERAIIDEIDVAEEVTNEEVKKKSLTRQEDHHDYYKSATYSNKDEASQIWSQFRNIPENSMLSSSHRRAMTIELKFDFPFYGSIVRNVTVATGGFIYTGEYVHSWLAATQYIAPLMANFDTSMSNDSFVRLQDNGTAYTVVWENVTLQDKPDFGKFTFSTTLHQNGDIVFVYYQLPTSINNIQDSHHPVKVGLSDAYIVDKSFYFARRKTIFEYHRVSFAQPEITNSTIIVLTALPTCLSYTDCHSCINHNTTFQCAWCPALNRCSTSTGNDRKKHEWVQMECGHSLVSAIEHCPAIGQRGNNAAQKNDNSNRTNSSNNNNKNTNNDSNSNSSNNNNTASATNKPGGSEAVTEPTISSTQSPTSGGAAGGDDAQHDRSEKLNALLSAENKNVGVAFGFMVPLCLVFAVTLWLFYAYRNPHTRSGQILIQFRPSQWSWRRGEARYTAATIHM